MSNTQKQKILDHLARRGSVTTMEAFTELGITKLTTRISELRRDGYDIVAERVVLRDNYGRVKTRFNRYRLNDR